jgi:hypothetical protein
MRTNAPFKASRQRIAGGMMFWVIVALLVAGSSEFAFAQQAQPKTFPSASQGAEALYQAVKNHDDSAVRAILGAGPELTSSGDEALDKLQHERFAQKYLEMHRLVREPDGSTVLYIGAENWPFPVPLVAKAGKWHFDPDAGAQEIVARKIGENEITAIQVCRDFGKTTQPGAEQESSGDPALEFARKLAANAPEANQPFDGYRFRTGSEQSPGVALVAYPVEYGVSGVMTLIVLPGGSIYEKDLGPQTATLATQIKGKPAGDWTIVP